jgi:hypothetical protein
MVKAMKFETRAWENHNFVIFDSKPLLATKIENQLEQELSENTKVFSFDSYEDAFDHCKSCRSDIIFFLSINDLSTDYENIFTQIRLQSEKTGNECLLVPLYEESTIFIGKSLASRVDLALKEIDKEKLMDTQHIQYELEDLWKDFYTFKEQQLIPRDLRATYTHLANAHKGQESIIFQRSTINILCLNLNLSWKDKIILNWMPILLSVYERQKEVLQASPRVMSEVEQFLTADNLPTKIFQESRSLNEKRSNGEVFDFLNNYQLSKGRRKSTIEKAIFNNRDKLFDLYAMEKNAEVKSA